MVEISGTKTNSSREEHVLHAHGHGDGEIVFSYRAEARRFLCGKIVDKEMLARRSRLRIHRRASIRTYLEHTHTKHLGLGIE